MNGMIHTNIHVYCVDCDIVFQHDLKYQDMYTNIERKYGHCCQCQCNWIMSEKGTDYDPDYRDPKDYVKPRQYVCPTCHSKT
jgi:hypothetical protein